MNFLGAFSTLPEVLDVFGPPLPTALRNTPDAILRGEEGSFLVSESWSVRVFREESSPAILCGLIGVGVGYSDLYAGKDEVELIVGLVGVAPLDFDDPLISARTCGRPGGGGIMPR